MATEFERIEKLKHMLGSGDAAGSAAWLTGIGDDAAVRKTTPGQPTLVWTVDACVEGVHFERRFADVETLVARAVVAAVSDIFAMGATPSGLLCALCLPADTSSSTFDAIAAGLARGSRQTEAAIVGGNMSGGQNISVTITALGHCTTPVLRSGASVGEHVFVTGHIGGASIGLAALLRGAGDACAEDAPDDLASSFIERWRHPPVRAVEGALLATHATSAIDLSDGLAQDLNHLTQASGVGARIETARIPVASGFERACEAVGLAPVQAMLAGGEDYELLFTSESEEIGPWATRIGVVTRGTENQFLAKDGAVLEGPFDGHVH